MFAQAVASFYLTSLGAERHSVRKVTIPTNTCSSLQLYRLSLNVLMGRNRVADTTSLLNVGEEHLTLEREGSDLFASNRFRAFLFKMLPFWAFLSFHHLKADGYPEGSLYEPNSY